MKFSNARFILEPHKTDKSLTAKVNHGWAQVSQKINLIGLTVKVDTTFAEKEVKAGSKAYIREEFLHTQPWASKVLEAAGIEGQFIIVEPNFVEFVDAVEAPKTDSRSMFTAGEQ